MTTEQVPLNGHHTDAQAHFQTPWGIPLDPSVHGAGRVPVRTAAVFVDPDNPPATPRRVSGRPPIRDCIISTISHDLDLHVTHLVDGGDRVAFTGQSHYQDGTQAVTTSTAELRLGLITAQHTILVWEQNW